MGTKKFIFVSRIGVTRPEAASVFLLNTMFRGVMGYKIDAENYIRKSGINYVIIRPCGIKQKTVHVGHEDRDMRDNDSGIYYHVYAE